MWHGIDTAASQALAQLADSPDGRRILAEQQGDYWITAGMPLPLGPAVAFTADVMREIENVTASLHRCLERLVSAATRDLGLLRLFTMPRLFPADFTGDCGPDWNLRVHLCRPDLLPVPGGFRIIEGNANCPAGLAFGPSAARSWYEIALDRLPTFRFVDPGTGADAFVSSYLQLATKEAGEPATVALIREEGGNSLELADLEQGFSDAGVACFQADPREIRISRTGARAGDRTFNFAYLKLGMQSFIRLRDELDPLVSLLRDGRLHVQNGTWGRWLADDKIAMSIIFDSRYQALFDEADRQMVCQYLPWSGNPARVDRRTRNYVEESQNLFVLKHGLDTRGKSVRIGRAMTKADWPDAVRRAWTENWLVQEYVDACYYGPMERHVPPARFDAAIGLVNGIRSFGFSRRSSLDRLNAAQGGMVHPILISQEPYQ
jgi:hypothetical protein